MADLSVGVPMAVLSPWEGVKHCSLSGVVTWEKCDFSWILFGTVGLIYLAAEVENT